MTAWRHATPREVWLLDIEDRPTLPYRVVDLPTGPAFTPIEGDGGTGLAVTSPSITAGERLWPRGQS